MDAIEKAKVAQFRDQVATQLKSIQDQQVNAVRLQGALSACDYILNLDPVTLADEDEVTPDDIANGEKWMAENPN